MKDNLNSFFKIILRKRFCSNFYDHKNCLQNYDLTFFPVITQELSSETYLAKFQILTDLSTSLPSFALIHDHRLKESLELNSSLQIYTSV